MKCFLFVGIWTLFATVSGWAQLRFVDAADLGLVNKLGPSEKRYHRVETAE